GDPGGPAARVVAVERRTAVGDARAEGPGLRRRVAVRQLPRIADGAAMTRIARLDSALLRASPLTKFLVPAATVCAMVWTSLPNIPRQWFDFDRVSWLAHLDQQPEYGTDTLSDMYGARVV